MSETELPRWIKTTVLGPLVLLVIINGIGTYYGQKSLNDAVAAIKQTVSSLPTKDDLKASNKFLEYRIQALERQQKHQEKQINANHDAIMSSKRNSVWHPPYKLPVPHSMLTATLESRPMLRWVM